MQLIKCGFREQNDHSQDWTLARPRSLQINLLKDSFGALTFIKGGNADKIILRSPLKMMLMVGGLSQRKDRSVHFHHDAVLLANPCIRRKLLIHPNEKLVVRVHFCIDTKYTLSHMLIYDNPHPWSTSLTPPMSCFNYNTTNMWKDHVKKYPFLTLFHYLVSKACEISKVALVNTLTETSSHLAVPLGYKGVPFAHQKLECCSFVFASMWTSRISSCLRYMKKRI